MLDAFSTQAYRLLPNCSAPSTGGGSLASNLARHHLDPRVPLCRFALRGDLDAPAQLLAAQRAGRAGADRVEPVERAEEVVYMEDDFWVTPDFYASVLWLRELRTAHCRECVGAVAGEHPRDWTVAHAGPRTCTPPVNMHTRARPLTCMARVHGTHRWPTRTRRAGSRPRAALIDLQETEMRNLMQKCHSMRVAVRREVLHAW